MEKNRSPRVPLILAVECHGTYRAVYRGAEPAGNMVCSLIGDSNFAPMWRLSAIRYQASSIQHPPALKLLPPLKLWQTRRQTSRIAPRCTTAYHTTAPSSMVRNCCPAPGPRSAGHTVPVCSVRSASYTAVNPGREPFRRGYIESGMAAPSSVQPVCLPHIPPRMGLRSPSTEYLRALILSSDRRKASRTDP